MELLILFAIAIIAAAVFQGMADGDGHTGQPYTLTVAGVAVPELKNLTFNIEKGEVDGTRRGDGGWFYGVATTKRVTMSCFIPFREADTIHGVLRNAHVFNTDLAFVVSRPDGSSATGTARVTDYGEPQELDGLAGTNVTLKSQGLVTFVGGS